MTKFLNADLDTTLGGSTPSDEKVSSQKAIKSYVDNRDNTKVDKTSTASQVYTTNGSGIQTTITYDNALATGNTIVQRNVDGQIVIASPTADTHGATKKYVDDINTSIQQALDTKVDKTSNVKKVYATDGSGNQTTLSYSQSQNASYLVQRDANAQVPVPETPVADENATSKKYVDTELAKKPDITSLDDVAFSGDYNDLVNTPTYKTINSEVITGTGNISLQTKLSGTNGNVVTYTATTGTLGELGFDSEPTQNSSRLVKSGSIWTELHKKINYTDIVNDLTSGGVAVPLSAEQGKELDQKITLAQQSTHDRGIVLNALTSQGQNYTVSTATINTAGSNYVVGDALFYVSSLGIDTILNVITVDASGGITGIAIGQGGAFTTSPAATGVSFVGGSGSGAKFNLTASQVANSTLNSLQNLQPNDFATVLYDEIHNGLRYVWKYADIDGDGTYEWIVGYPITNIERNFQEQPIENTELASNAVTTVKIADLNVTKEKLADNSIISRHITVGTITDSHIATNADIDQSKIKDLTTDLASKVDKTTDAYQVYGTSASDTQTTLTYSTSNTGLTIVQRDSGGQVNVAQTPSSNTNATSKKYVDDQLANKVDKVATSKRVYGTDNSGNQTTYDYDSFGKIDDVKVGDTSVVVNKIASLGTMAGESKDNYIKAKATPIIADTKCKITYDADGLVTAGANLEASDIPSLTLAKISDVTATATEVNVLDGITVSTTELNYSDGLTSNIQTQLDEKQVTLVSGTNIKTLNNGSLLGSGNISITGLPSQTDQSGKFLTTNGTSASWSNVPNEIPSQSGNSGKFLTTDGTAVSWIDVSQVPSQTGSNGKFLTTNGTAASWSAISQVPSQTGNSGKFLTTDGTDASWTSISQVPAQSGQSGKFLTTNGTAASWTSLSATDIPNLSLSKITDVTATATEVNVLDGITASTSELNVLDGITASTAELNILDGVTATASELNILDGATLTTTELNYVDGVTSSIQTQLDNKVAKNNSAQAKAYGTTSAGVETAWKVSSSASASTLAYRGTNGILQVGTPTSDEHAATKKYVDDSMAAVIPSQSGNTGKYLTTDGSSVSWATVDALPTQTGNSGKFLTTNGTTASWSDPLPSQSGNSGKFLTTNGTTTSWGEISAYTASEVQTIWNSITSSI